MAKVEEEEEGELRGYSVVPHSNNDRVIGKGQPLRRFKLYVCPLFHIWPSFFSYLLICLTSLFFLILILYDLVVIQPFPSLLSPNTIWLLFRYVVGSYMVGLDTFCNFVTN